MDRSDTKPRAVPCLAATLTALLSLAGSPCTATAAPVPLFTHPPTGIENVTGVIPLGNVSPFSDHILPTDHMYLIYPDNGHRGDHSYPVYAMAGGRIVMVMWRQRVGLPDEYELYIRHNRYVTSYVMDFEASESIRNYLASTGSGWTSLGEGSIMILGQLGAPAPLPVAAGDQVGTTRDFFDAWDVGVIDSRVTAGRFLGRGVRRYPGFKDFIAFLGLPDIPRPYRGHKLKNAVSFIRYMTPELRAAWYPLLVSDPKRHGRVGWDVDGRLRGVWFNAAVDTIEPAPVGDLEYAVVSVVPYNLAPATKIQIGVAHGHALAALDPTGSYPQLRRDVIVQTDLTPGARVNPDPKRVSVDTGTVCYDVTYLDNGTTRFNSLLFRLVGTSKVVIKFDPTPHDASQCPSRIGEEPDATWFVYVR